MAGQAQASRTPSKVHVESSTAFQESLQTGVTTKDLEDVGVVISTDPY